MSEFGVTDAYDLVVIENVHIEVPDGFNSGVNVFPPTQDPDGRAVIVRNSTVLGGWRGVSAGEDVPELRAIGNTLVGGTTPGSSAIALSRGASGLIEDNSLSDCPESCINVGGGDPTSGTVQIVGNQITGDVAQPLINPIVATGGSVQVIRNVIEGAGIEGTLTLHSGDFTNYASALALGPPDGIDLTCNWWGSVDGPQNAPIDPSVFTPWATQPVAGTSATTC